MNQATLLRESRSKHTLKSYDAAVRQFRAFREVLPITTKNPEFSVPTPKKQDSSSRQRQTN
jgi:hypothetical protein